MSAAKPPVRLRCEQREDPLGIDARTPHLGWAMPPADGRRGQRQTAYQVRVASSVDTLVRGDIDLWDSGRVEVGDLSPVPYDGAPLRSRQRCAWQVRTWDEDGRESPFSAPAWWEMGLLDPDDWSAEWITADFPDLGGEPEPCAYLRTSFEVDERPRSARVYATALGVYELWCNGRRVSDDVLRPGWTEYSSFVPYQTYDLGPLLVPGENAFGIVLGGGWYSGCMGVGGFSRRYGDQPQVLVQIEIEGEHGRQTVGTGPGWTQAFGPLRSSDMLMGERYDARRSLTRWSEPGTSTDWPPARLGKPYEGLLVAAACSPVRPTEELRPVSITEMGSGHWLVDLGQNIAGWARLRVEGEAGEEVVLRYAEMTHPDGSLYTDNLRAAAATDTYVLRGTGTETWEPTFTTHGFRYVEVSGYPGTPGPDDVTGVVVRSDLPVTGDFSCSDDLVNQLHRNVVWSQKGNLVELPTDCPQRDERLGWLGDAQIFAAAATYNMDVAAFFTKWMADVMETQSEEGSFADVAPLSFVDSDGAPAWADAGVIVPWTMYQRYGDRTVLEACFPAMSRWVDYLDRNNPDHLWRNRRGNDYGDWLSVGADTPGELVGSAYFARSTELVARTAAVLGLEEQAQRYRALRAAIGAAYADAYIGPDGRIAGDTQGAYVLSLAFGLVPDELQADAAAHLVADVEARDDHLSTGFLATSYLLDVIAEEGQRLDLAYRLLLQESYPSWGYSIRQGATTIWEFWDGWTEHGGFREDPMSSFNHYSFGAVDRWLYASVAGLDVDPSGPGYRRAVIRPRPGGGLRYASAWHESVRGRFEVGWRLDGERFELDVTIPPDSVATVHVPSRAGSQVEEGGVKADTAPGVRPLSRSADAALYEIGSGVYRFVSAP